MSNQFPILDDDEKSFLFNLLGMSNEAQPLEIQESLSQQGSGLDDLEDLFDLPSVYQFTMATPPQSEDGKSQSVKSGSRPREIKNQAASSLTSKLSILGTIQGSRKKWNDDRLEWLDLVDRNSFGKFECPKCSRLYTRKSNLKVHYASSHIGLKRFVCPGCSKQFARTGYVKQHQRICPNIFKLI